MSLVAAVKSTSGRNVVYAIHKHGVGDWECTCPSYRFAKPDAKGRKFPCKHLRLAWALGQMLKAIEHRDGFKDGITVYDAYQF